MPRCEDENINELAIIEPRVKNRGKIIEGKQGKWKEIFS